MLATTSKLLERLQRVETILAFLRRTWPLESPLEHGLSELELEVREARHEARYLGELLDEAEAVVRSFDELAETTESELELKTWVDMVTDRLRDAGGES